MTREEMHRITRIYLQGPYIDRFVKGAAKKKTTYNSEGFSRVKMDPNMKRIR